MIIVGDKEEQERRDGRGNGQQTAAEQATGVHQTVLPPSLVKITPAPEAPAAPATQSRRPL